MWERTSIVACTPHTMRLPNWPTVYTSHVAGKTVTRSKTGCAPNRNSCTTTRNREAKSTTQDALKWRRSSERIIYEIPKTDVGDGVSHVRHAAGTGGQGDRTHVERPDKPSWQGRFDDHCGLSSGQYGRNPSPQCTWVYLPAGRLDRDAAEGRKRGDA